MPKEGGMYIIFESDSFVDVKKIKIVEITEKEVGVVFKKKKKFVVYKRYLLNTNDVFNTLFVMPLDEFTKLFIKEI